MKSREFGAVPFLVLLALAGVTAASAQPAFDKSFIEDSIGPGSVSTLRFDIDNGDEVGVTNLAFSDVLPAAITIADPPKASTDCTAAILSAPPGGTTIVFSDGQLAPLSACSVTVDVTSSTLGTHTNISGDLTSSAGNSGPATADLTVDATLPGFTKSFSPNPIVPGDTSTLTLTIDNTQNGDNVDRLSFVDNLPDGLVVASPATPTTDCTGGVLAPTITAVSGSSSISLSFGFAEAGTSCFVAVEVTAETAGAKGNTTDVLTFLDVFDIVEAGKAGATLGVERRFLVKVFPDDPVPPGGIVTLEFSLTNFDRASSATDIAFTDDLDAVLTDLVAIGLPLADPCGSGSLLTGTDLLSLTGGELGPEESCTFSVPLQVPAGAATGTYVNTTSEVTADVGGEMVTEDPAIDELVVAPVPALTKSFVDDPITPGDSVTLSFTITNSSATASATGISFSDILFDEITGASVTPGPDPCGAGSSATFTPPGQFDLARIDLVGGSLDPAGSCSFDFVLDLSPQAAAGSYLNRTSDITAVVDGSPVAGRGASDTLAVVAAPDLTKDFTTDPVLPGELVTLEFTLDLTPESPADVTDIAFTDDLDAVISGLEAVGLPLNDICGAGSELAGTSVLSFTGGSLSPDSSCTFGLSLQVPSGILPGNRTNVTSEVSGMALGIAVESQPATADLVIAGLDFAKTFTDDPVLAGDTVTLEFTIDNLSEIAGTSDMTFTDDLDDVLPGLTALGLPLADPCGAGSELSAIAGDTLLVFTGGNLAPETSCTFSVTLLTPAGALADDYLNRTSALVADIDTSTVTVDPATDILSIFEPLSIIKTFLGDPVPPGELVDLEFVLTNLSTTDSITGIAFTDDLEAALSGLVAIGLPASDVCGAGSVITGTNLLSFTGGTLAPDSSCTFTVTLQVPIDVESGTVAINTTSEVTGMAGGFGTTGDPATDDLLIDEVPPCDEFLLEGPSKVTADVPFDLEISCATAEAVIRIGAGRQLGTSARAISGCGILVFDVAPRLNNFGLETADEDGDATSTQTLGSPFAGRTLHYQVIDSARCAVSNVLSIDVNE